jgi:hypothetical protein
MRGEHEENPIDRCSRPGAGTVKRLKLSVFAASNVAKNKPKRLKLKYRQDSSAFVECH